MVTVRQVLVSLVALSATQALAASRAPLSVRREAVAPPCADCVPGEILVALRPGAGAVERRSVLGMVGAAPVATLRGPAEAKSLHAPEIVRARVTTDVAAALDALRSDPAVAYAEPVYRVRASAVANDPLYADGSQWGTFTADSPAAIGPAGTTNAFGMGAEAAWNRGMVGRGDVYVGLLDEGVARLHPDIDSNCWRNVYETADGRDNDGNGYVDDLYGWDFVARDGSVYDGGTAGTTDRHGTHVAGIVGAEGGNGAGVAGVAWHVGMIPLKVMSNGLGTTASVVQGLDYLTDMKTRHGMNVVAVNCSFTVGSYSQALNDAVLRAARAGILVVCAAGNDGVNADSTPVWPGSFDTRVATSTQGASSYDAVLCVGALDRFGALAASSNWGARTVDIAAPGVEIVSTAPPSGYATLSGSSMAAAHVTGAIALQAASVAGLTAVELRNAFLSGATPTASLSGKVVTGGRLDYARVVAATPAHDVAVTALSGPGSVAQSRTVTVNVTIANQGNVTETVTLALIDTPPSGGVAGTVSAPRSVTLGAGASAVVAMSWTTTNATTGYHTLTAQLRQVTGETDTADNIRSTLAQVTAIMTPSVASVAPSVVRGGTTQVVSITGSGFATGAVVTFLYGTGPVPRASGIVVSSDGTRLSCSVTASATSVAGAPWDVVVTNPDGRTGRKLDALTVSP